MGLGFAFVVVFVLGSCFAVGLGFTFVVVFVFGFWFGWMGVFSDSNCKTDRYRLIQFPNNYV